MKQVFKKGSIEKLLQVFITEKRDIIPQRKLIYTIGSGTFYDAFRELNSLGILIREPCFDEEKRKEVICVRLTEKGKKIVKLLEEIYKTID